MGPHDNLIVPVVLAGGKGTRLWPLSRPERPKQFLPLTSHETPFQQTLRRIAQIKDFYGPPLIITNYDYRFLVAEQAAEVGAKLAGIVLEPISRNTAPAIANACWIIKKQSCCELMHIIPCDHHIIAGSNYRDALHDAKAAARHNQLITFGIKPDKPSTDFGYIKAQVNSASIAHKIISFVEKPSLSEAQKLLNSGTYYWNSGMFMFNTSVFLDECKKLAPEIYSLTKTSVDKAVYNPDFIQLEASSFSKLPDISVDYAIFEKTNRAQMVPANIDWADLGTWSSLWKAVNQD